MKRKEIKCTSWKSNKKLYAYGSEEPLSIIGDFETELKYRDRYCSTCFVVIEQSSRPILSRLTCEMLGVLRIEVNAVDEQDLLEEYKECFSGVGKLKNFQAKLHVDEKVAPVAQKLRPIPFGLRERVEHKLEKLVDYEITEEETGPTPWVSPVVVVTKPCGDIRLRVDMRRANEAILRERHPIPTVDNVLHNLNGSATFSKLDLKLGFHQIELDEQFRDITTFVTHKGLYRYKRLSLGIN